MKILVTGGAGFIGSHLVDTLVQQGHDVIVLDNLDPQVHQGQKPSYLNKEVKYIWADVRDSEALLKAIKNVEVVFHEAAVVGIGQSMYEIKKYMDVNTSGTANLLDFIINNSIKLKKIIVASSMSIYGEGEYNCPKCGKISPELRNEVQLRKRKWEMICLNCGRETQPIGTSEGKRLYPTSVYALSKMDQEILCLMLGKSYKIPTVALRYFNAYGPRQSLSNPYTGVCAIFISRLKNDHSPHIYEDGLQSRDFVSVKDIVQANILALENSDMDYQSFNVGTGIATTIAGVADILAKLHNKTIEPTRVNKYRVGDIRHCFADISKIKKAGYNPSLKLEEGLKELAQWSSQAEADDMMEKVEKELEQRDLKF